MNSSSSPAHDVNEEELVVLVVEDDDQDFFLLQRSLRKSLDVRFLRVSTVRGAVILLTEKNIDVVLLDLSLPDSHGLDTVTQVVGKSSAPVVVLTGTDDEQTGLSAMHCGAQDYLVKGIFDDNLLNRAIRYAVERYRLMDELNESRALIRRDRELRRLKSIDSQKANTGTLEKRFGSIYLQAQKVYSRILDDSVEQRGFKVDKGIPQRLNRLAELLGSYRAVPSDVVNIHTSVISGKLEDMDMEKCRIYTEEGRFLLTGLLGHLCSFYIEHCEISPGCITLDRSASNDSGLD